MLYNLYNKFKVHVVGLVFLLVRLKHFDLRDFFTNIKLLLKSEGIDQRLG